MTDSLGSPREAREVVTSALLGWEMYRGRPVDDGVQDEAAARAEIAVVALPDAGWTLLPPPGSTEWEAAVERGVAALLSGYGISKNRAQEVRADVDVRRVLSALTETKET